MRDPSIRTDRLERQNARRARSLNADGAFTEAEVAELYKKQNGRCIYCKARLGSSFARDHVVAISRGGSNYISNIQLLCNGCNCKKHSLDHHVFAAKMGLLV